MKHQIVVNYSPEIHDGYMAYYWHVDIITDDGVFVVGCGWSDDIDCAVTDALDWADENVGG